ncbi:hypothetical protein BC830DRAFT_1155270 [Chytriomyces sp. MP71]|nr:hypothetical protein BC830DRAFT_1155270 [Chytriomyces sp. MP71]
MMQQSIMKAILIYREKLTPSSHKVIMEMAPNYDISLFKEAELMVNITHHSLVPKHVVEQGRKGYAFGEIVEYFCRLSVSRYREDSPMDSDGREVR